MPASVGQRLSQTRLKRGISFDEASHVTRLRPDLLLALENENFARFGSNVYAKSSLAIYARYLGVDVSDFIHTLESTNPIRIKDYQYLSTPPPASVLQPASTVPDLSRPRQAPSLLPLFFFALVIVGSFFGLWIYANSQRIFVAPAVPPSATPPPAVVAVATPIPITPIPVRVVVPATPAPQPIAPTIDHDTVSPISIGTPDATPRNEPPGGINEILVASVKTTWVVIRKDDPKSPPIFEDFLYPTASPLKLRGARFFIEARDPAAVQITKNGLPVAYQAPSVPIQ